MTLEELLAAAVVSIQDELPALLGSQWPEFKERLEPLQARLDGGGEAARSEVLALFREHPAAYARLVERLSELQVRLVTARKAADARGPDGGLPSNHDVVPVYYATDRAPANDSTASPYYGVNRGPLSFGRTEVSIPPPPHHERGKVERPTWWRFEFREDPEWHVVVMRVAPLRREDFLAGLRSDLRTAGRNDALVFVHGYNVLFEDALRRTAQIAHDLQFGGAPILFSWPSEGKTSRYSYTVDETNVHWAVPHFETFLKLALTELGVDTVHVIAHSMGNRLLVETLRAFDVRSLAGPGRTLAKLRQIVLAAPDIDAATFAGFAPKFRDQAERFTLYYSVNDLALAMSKFIHRYGRAGFETVIAQGIDTIDASDMDTSLLGHSGFAENRSILGDMFDLLTYGHAPDGRFGLVSRRAPAGAYWTFDR